MAACFDNTADFSYRTKRKRRGCRSTRAGPPAGAWSLPSRHVLRFVILQQPLDFRRIIAIGPFHPHQPHKIPRPRRDLRVFAGRRLAEDVEGLEAQGGRLRLGPLAHE